MLCLAVPVMQESSWFDLRCKDRAFYCLMCTQCSKMYGKADGTGLSDSHSAKNDRDNNH